MIKAACIECVIILNMFLQSIGDCKLVDYAIDWRRRGEEGKEQGGGEEQEEGEEQGGVGKERARGEGVRLTKFTY